MLIDESFLQALIENISDVVLVLTGDGRIKYASPSVEHLFGYTQEEIAGRSAFELVHPDEIKRAREALSRRVDATDWAAPAHYRVRTKDGVWRTVEAAGKSFMDDPAIGGIIYTLRDVSERKRSEDEIRLLQSLTHSISQSSDLREALAQVLAEIGETGGWHYGEAWVPSADGSVLEHVTGWISGANGVRRFEDASHSFAFPPGVGLPGRVWSSKKAAWIADVTQDANFPRAAMARAVGFKTGVGIPVLAAGEVVLVLAFFQDDPLEEDRRFLDLVSSVAVQLGEIVRRKRAEDALRESELRYRSLVERIPAVVYTARLGKDPAVLYVSPQIEPMLGFPASEWTKSLDFWVERIHPDDRGRLLAELEKAEGLGGLVVADYRLVSRDGRVIWVRDEAFVSREEAGRPAVIQGVMMDISSEKTLQDQLRHAQKMEAVGQLAGGIAHDFNNILTTVIGYAHLLRRKLAPENPARPDIDQVLSAAERAAGLTRSLLAFSRKQSFSPWPVEVNALVRQAAKFLSRIIGERIDLTLDLSEKDLTVMADHTQIEQVLMNLITNARDAMPEGGSLDIQTRPACIDESFLWTYGYGKPGAYALITVADTGAGMDEETRRHVFEPFFTTKEVGKGTGLGLAIVYGIVKQHEGYIDVSSEPGKGTTFKIHLPIVEAEAREAALAAPEFAPGGGTETILVAEDDAGVRPLLGTILGEAGYHVLEAANGEEAVARFREQADKINLLLLDVIMPRRNGREALEAIRVLRPDVPVLFLSGYTADIIRKKGILEEGFVLLSKPISPQEILTAVRNALDAAGKPGARGV